jgi:hypothetical protein
MRPRRGVVVPALRRRGRRLVGVVGVVGVVGIVGVVGVLGVVGCSKPAPVAAAPAAPPPAPVVVAAAAAGDGAIERARRLALEAVERGDLDGALCALDDVLGATQAPKPLPGADAEVVVRARCDRAAVLSRRAAATRDERLRERLLRDAVVDCATGENAVVVREALANALLLRARSLGDDASARRARRALLEESLATTKTVAAAVDLALLCEQDDDDAAALAAVEVAVALLPGDARLLALRDRLKRHHDVEGGFKTAAHSHFVARFEGYGEERLAWGVLDVLERAWFSLGQRLDLHPPEAITVVIYTGDQYRQATGTPDWSAGAFDGKIRIREGLLAAERGTLEDTLVHEYVHAALHEVLPTQPIPPWFHEGLAQLMEQRSGDPSTTLQSTGKAPLEVLARPFVQLDARAAHAAYATSLAMLRTLHARRGDYGLAQLLSALKNGSSFDDALQAGFSLTTARLWDAVE